MFTLHNGDCLEYLASLGEVDALISDVPYGLKGEEPFEVALKAIKMTKYKVAAIITDWRNSSLMAEFPDKVGELIWEYGWISGGRTKAKFGVLPTHNTIHLLGDIKRLHFTEGTIIKRQPGFSSPRQTSYAKKTGHPYEKPVPLMRYLIDRMDCQTIVDPFMGSGATIKAAEMAGRDSIGIEKEKAYFNMAVLRLQSPTPSNNRLHLTGGESPANLSLFPAESTPPAKLPAKSPRR